MSLGQRPIITLLFMAALLALSVVPGRAHEGDSFFIWAVAATPSLLQKVMHVLLYAVLAFLWAWTLEAVGSMYLRLIVALSLAISFGGLMEWAQTHIPGRYGALGDVLLNAAGAMLGLAAAILLL